MHSTPKLLHPASYHLSWLHVMTQHCPSTHDRLDLVQHTEQIASALLP